MRYLVMGLCWAGAFMLWVIALFGGQPDQELQMWVKVTFMWIGIVLCLIGSWAAVVQERDYW